MKFELNSLPRNCSNEEIIAEIRRVDAIVNKDILIKKDFGKHSKIHPSTLMRRFGDWHKVLELAGLAYKYSGRVVSEKQRQQQAKYMTNDEILAELRNIARNLNKNSVTVEDVKNHSRILGPATVSRRFGSWPIALQKAGLEVSLKYYRKYSDEEYFENLLNVWAHYGRQPIWSEMKISPSEIGPDGYVNRFGGWRKALETFVKHMNKDGERENKTILKNSRTDSLIREEIKRHSIPVENRRNIPPGLKWKILHRDNFRCVKCGYCRAVDKTYKDYHIDHIVPFSKGGKTVLENLQLLCEDCNLGKGNRHLE